ncbi:MAG: S8 family serine peptidase [Chitinophagales bacterium]
MRNFITFLLVLLLCFSADTSAQPSTFASKQLIVKFGKATTDLEKRSIQNELAASDLLHFRGIDAYLWKVPEASQNVQGKNLKGVQEMVDYLNRLPQVEYAEPNYKYELLTTPNDPHLPQLWGMENIETENAWTIAVGSSDVVVGVIDTGIDWTHPDLVDNIWNNLGEDADGDGHVLEYINGQWVFDPDDENGIDDDGNGYVDDFIGWDFFSNDNKPQDGHSHGTHCSGTIAAKGNNGIGVVGVSWHTQVAALKIFNDGGSTNSAAILNAIQYSITNDMPITSNSWGGGSYSQALADMITLAEQNNQLFVAAAGNYSRDNDTTPFYPASYTHDNIISVGASNSFDQMSYFSHYGLTSVDCFAPGSGIYSTVPSGYGFKSGTSMACPHVSGLAALILSECSELSYADVKAQILGNVDVLPVFDGKCVSNGRINAFQALSNSTCCDVVADFSVPATVCENASFSFTNNSINANFYVWDFGDGNTSASANPTHTYSNMGTYTVSLTAISGECVDIYTQTIMVQAATDASFLYDINDLIASFYANSDNENSYNWTVDGVSFSNDVNANYTFADYGVYEICLEANGVCGSDVKCETLTFLCELTPNIKFQKSFGGSGSDVMYSISPTNDGGIIMAGKSSSNDGDVTENNGSSDFWIIKLDSLNNIEWEKSYGGSGNDVANSIMQTSDNGYIVAGYSNSSDGDKTVAYGGNDFWVLKLNSFGELDWEKSLGGNDNDVGQSIQQTNEGGYIVVGETKSNTDDVLEQNGHTDFWIVKLNNLGNIEWSKSLGGTLQDICKDVKQTVDGGYITVGWAASADGDVSNNNGIGNGDYWVVKLDNNGNILWEKTFGGPNWDRAYSVKLANDGGYFVSGWTTGGVAGFHGGPSDHWVIKIDSLGNLQWEIALGGSGDDIHYAIDKTADNGCIVVGGTQSNDGDVTVSYGNWDWFVVKLDNSGEIEWQRTLGGTGREIARAVFQKNDGSYLVTGYTQSNDTDVTESFGSDDVWLVHLGAMNANFIASSFETCMMQTTTFTNVSTGAISYEWQINNQTISTNTDLTHTFTQAGDYLITLIATNTDGCRDTYSEMITVSESCVWPGDCNNDGTANFYDFLAVGLAFENTGIARTDNAIDWAAKYATDWQTSFSDALYDGTNHKFADSNGDGTINFSDTLAILNNLYLTHPTATDNTEIYNYPEAIITPEVNNFALYENAPIAIDLKVRSSFNNAGLSMYGLVFEISYVGSNPYLDFSNSCLGILGVDFMATYRVNTTTQKITVAITRINQQDTLCNNSIASLIVVVDEVPIGDPIDFSITTDNALIVNREGNIIPTGGESVAFNVFSVFDVAPTLVQSKAFLQENFEQPSDFGLLSLPRMKTDLRTKNLLPLSQPFNVLPWSYNGVEEVMSVEEIPVDVVDWVMLEVRDVLGENIIEQKAAFLLADGNIVDVNGQYAGVAFYNLQENESYFLIIRSRNHLDVMSSNLITAQNGRLIYDFTTSASQAMLNQMVEVGDNIFALHAADFDGNGIINISDFNIYNQQSSQINSYIAADADLDGHVTIADFNFYLLNRNLVGFQQIRY